MRVLEDNYSVDYAITITTKGKGGFKDKTSEDQFEEISEYIYKNMRDIGIRWTLFAELHKDMSSVHLHGFVKFELNKIPGKYRNYPPRYLTDLLKKFKPFGYTCIKQVTDFAVWKDYIAKNCEEFMYVTGIHPLIIDDYDMFTLKF